MSHVNTKKFRIDMCWIDLLSTIIAINRSK